MRKFLTSIVLFLVVYSILHVIAICSLGNNRFFNLTYYKIGSYGHMFTRIKDIPNHPEPEILFLGSSRAYRSFDTRVFENAGFSTFNLGSSSQTPMQTEVLLKKYLDEINPKSILFEVYYGVFLNNGIESTTDLISNDHIDAEICKLAIKSKNIKVINTLIYGAYQEYCRGIRNTYQEKIIKEGDMYVKGGYIEKKEYTPFIPSDSKTPIEFSNRIQPHQIKAFGNCIKIIQDKHIPYYLVTSPSPRSINSRFSEHKAFKELMSSYGPYQDFNEIIQLNDSCFYDATHLSPKGVELFDECLIHVLDSIGFIKTK